MKVLMYCSHFYKIGGIETFVKNFVKRLKDTYELTVMYEVGDEAQLNVLKKMCNVEKFVGQEVETDIVIYSSAWGQRPIDKIKAKKRYQMIHADWEAHSKRTGTHFIEQKGIDGYIAVSEQAAKSFEKLYGIKSVVIYNLLDIEFKTEKVLNFITASRMGREKGFERIIEMAKRLKAGNYKFVWHIYGDIPELQYKNEIFEKLKEFPEIVIMKPRLDILSFIANADYLVQLSDTEAFCYSIYEALQVGTPCIVTEFPSAYEQIVEGKNGYILKFDLSNLDIDKIYNEIPKDGGFTEKSTEKDWIKFIGKPKTKPPKYIPTSDVKVRVMVPYFDTILGRKTNIDEIFEASPDRANLLVERKKCVLL